MVLSHSDAETAPSGPTSQVLEELRHRWLAELEAGRISLTELAERILQHQHPGRANYESDVDRRRRCGLGEVIFGTGKPPEMIAQIAHRLLAAGENEVLVTRVDSRTAALASSRFAYARYDMLGRTLRLRTQRMAARADDSCKNSACVAVVCAGSTDLPVAREALETLAWMEVNATCIVDIGVAGPYRLLAHLEKLRQCVAVVVIAGMEGALASVVGGLVACPVIAVPTSVGYGANLQGVTTLLSMLSSCAAGVTVVNIDAGFKGGYVAGLIARQHHLRQLVDTSQCRSDCTTDQADDGSSSN